MKFQKTLLSRLLALSLLTCLVGCTDSNGILLQISATIELPVNPDLPEAGRFIPADIPLLYTFTIANNTDSPYSGDICLRVVSDQNVEFHRMTWPVSELQPGTHKLERLYRIRNLPGSRKITVQAAISDKDGNLQKLGQNNPQIWHDVFKGYALHSSTAWSNGWYMPDDAKTLARGCTGEGIIHIPFPLFPSVLRIKGSAPIQCFEDNQWTLSMLLNTQPLFQHVVSKTDFEFSATIEPPFFMPECDSPSRSWPVGVMELGVHSDKIFDPVTCLGIDDNRRLAFHLFPIEYGDFLAERGFYGDRETDGHYWPAPEFSVLLPASRTASHVLIQGRRDVACMDIPQSMSVSASGQNLGSVTLDSESFFLSLPLTANPETDNPISLVVTISPIYFRSQCQDTDDPRPYGVGIEEICFRSYNR